ncbi:hypothetical protein HHK36_030254 [Tetracentron sinense]|uniref:Clp ATPase C-terminal domain-containing protein n=1 Tax=Tetracentron sinense TaxID=13715 RepID=A0A834YEU5_TETSI|nr:hypothetical protein HHK36_030254 [Tetracentron sinense]
MMDVASHLAKRGIALAVSDAALDIILAESHDPVYGARPIRKWLEKKVVTELSKMLLKEEIDENSTVSIDAGPGGKELIYVVEKNGGLMNSTTDLVEEYKKCKESVRRFQPVYVADTISILRGVKERYDGHHGVQIQDQALVVASKLSSRYITGLLPNFEISTGFINQYLKIHGVVWSMKPVLMSKFSLIS